MDKITLLLVEFTKFKDFIIFTVKTVDVVRETDHDSAVSDLSLRPNLFHTMELQHHDKAGTSKHKFGA